MRLVPVAVDGAKSSAIDATVLDEGLKARFPCNSSELSVKRMPFDKDFPTVRAMMLDCEREDGGRLAMISSTFADLGEARAQFEESAKTIAGRSARPDFLFKGMSAREYVMQNDRKCGWTRLILNGKRMVILAGERMEGDCAALDIESHAFFDSLELSER